MENITVKKYEEIDWIKLWQNGRREKSWTSKGSKDWDKKASSFCSRVSQSPYIPLFLSRLPLDKKFTVLDIGCGPGTLALPLANHVAHVTALDYSEKMLEILNDRAKEAKISNIESILCAWEDDWQERGIQPADIAIASRSMNVDDLSMAIDKLATYGKKFIFITDRIAPSPFDPDAFAAIGRDFNSGPDYIFTLNLLYSKNIHANVEVLELEQDAYFGSLEEAVQSYAWMFKDISEKETKKLEQYVASRATAARDGRVTIHRRFPPRWAMIWWRTS